MKNSLLVLMLSVLANTIAFSQCNAGPDYICGNELPTVGYSYTYCVQYVTNAVTYHWTMYHNPYDGDPNESFYDEVRSVPSIDLTFNATGSHFLVCTARDVNGDFIRAWYDILITPDNSSLKSSIIPISENARFLLPNHNNKQSFLWK